MSENETHTPCTPSTRAALIEGMSHAEAKAALSFMAGYWPDRFDELISVLAANIHPFRGGVGDE